MVGRTGDEGFFRDLAAQPVKHAGFGDDDEGLGRRLPAVADHFLGRAHFVGEDAHGVRALGVSDNRSGGVGRADFFDALTGEFDVDVAVALPERHGTSGLFGDPRAKVFVRDKEDVAVGGDTFDNFHRVAARADDIGERFDPGRAIDVSDDVIVLRGMLLEVSGQFVGRA